MINFFKKDPLSKVEVIPTDPIQALRYKHEKEMAWLDKQRKYINYFLYIMIGFFILSTSIALYTLVQDHILEGQAKNFCVGNGFKFYDGDCIENLDNGLVKIHKINYDGDQWRLVVEE